MPLASTADDLHTVLDEVGAPTHSGGIALAPEGRIRALHFVGVTDANRQRGRARQLETALRGVLAQLDAFDGCPVCDCGGDPLAAETHAADCALNVLFEPEPAPPIPGQRSLAETFELRS